jgi:AraC-like DNA-binding protein
LRPWLGKHYQRFQRSLEFGELESRTNLPLGTLMSSSVIMGRSSRKLTDIAARVGYSELSAFSRASRRWFGVNARSFRRNPPNLDDAA